MNHDLLLQYLTEMGTGEWRAFRDGLDYLADPDQQLFRSIVARNLSLLGHVEFAFFGDMAWAVCPEILVTLPGSKDVRAVLCGGRSQPFVESLTVTAEETGAALQMEGQEQGPTVIIIQGRSQDILAAIAERVGIPLALSVPARLASSLPRLQPWIALCEPGWEPLGYTVRVFDAENLRWQEVERPNGDGLYQYAYYRREYRLRQKGQSLRVPREIGMYAWLAHVGRNVLRYDPGCCELQVPRIARMPHLHARAVTLSSGRLPAVVQANGTITRVYGDVSEDVAHLLATALEQRLEV
jgi:hypothetical protein